MTKFKKLGTVQDKKTKENYVAWLLDGKEVVTLHPKLHESGFYPLKDFNEKFIPIKS